MQPSVGQQQDHAASSFPPQGHAYAPPPPPKRRRWLHAVIGVVIVLVVILVAPFLAPMLMGGGAADWGSRVTYSRQGDPRLGELRVGDFNYINACEVFTAKDYKDKVGDKLDLSVDATFATRTYGERDPLRTYESSCRRGNVNVEIHQFSSKDVQGKTDAFLPGFAADEEFARQLGETASWNATTHDLKFDMDNKHVFVGVMGMPDGEKARGELPEIALAIRSKIEERAARPSQMFPHPPKGQTVGAFPYHNACSLFTPDDYRRILDIEPDEGRIETFYFERLRRSEMSARSSCLIHALGPKTRPPDSGPADETFADVIAEVRTAQYDEDRTDSYTRLEADAEDQIVEGIGDHAYLEPISDGQILKVRQGNVEFDIEVFHALGGDTPAVTDPQQNLKALKKIARTVVDRLE